MDQADSGDRRSRLCFKEKRRDDEDTRKRRTVRSPLLVGNCDGRWVGEGGMVREADAAAWRTSGHRKGRTDSGHGIGISLFFSKL